jgi:hypothetical protein
MRVTSSWADASGGFLVLDVAGRDPGRLGGGKPTSPALVRSRIAAERPDASDLGDVFPIIGQTYKRVLLEPGEKLWFRRHDTQLPIIIERS